MVGKRTDHGQADRIRVHLQIRGRVQGVWFRGSAREEAERLGLVGWARNRPDGSVEILAQGDADAAQRFVEWCRQGPPGARVTDLAQTLEPPSDDLHDFRIRG